MKDLIRMNQLAGLITESQARKMMAVLNEYVEMDLNDLGPEFEKTIKEIFGETVKVIDIKATYRPSTDTGSKPSLYMSITIPQTKESNKALLLSIEFDKEGNGFIKYDNYSKDKEGTKEEFNTKLIPAFKKAAVSVLGKLVKNPEQLTSATLGSGYKYEEKDQADLDKYITKILSAPIKN
jgi:hypothetical protein